MKTIPKYASNWYDSRTNIAYNFVIYNEAERRYKFVDNRMSLYETFSEEYFETYFKPGGVPKVKNFEEFYDEF
jgi:hypothetical protein